MKLGTTELLIILAIIIILFGPSQIPKLTKMIGKASKSFREGAEGDSKNNPDGNGGSQNMEQ
ncbi:MAG: twin-arginine translocase TatA/TatE family subunit [Lachnospiraceae bacterium]|nr:twin-arginine translocase TatA/TatE family subunit [Lachnospiraceae bacterium]